MTPAYLIPEVYCNDCRHYCHCDEIHCMHPVGVGMTDKWQECKCKECKCSKTKGIK